ncbi:MAG: hypothetical protein JWO71_1467 [Candidatus Acidoferrum typicum]|nr:hypothetical protein [Candidatus Acidoferrum typicum]
MLFVTTHRRLATIALAVGVLGLVGLAVYLRSVNRLEPILVKASLVERHDAEAMAYIVTYVIPFLSIPFNGLQQGIAQSIFFVVLGILYVNSNMIHINPMLNLAGYHLYGVTLEDGGTHSLIARHRIVRGQQIRAIKLADDILLEKGDEN